MTTKRARMAQLCQTLRWIGPGALVVGMTIGAGCIIQDGKECDSRQVRMETAATDYCECAAGFVVDTAKGYGCVAAAGGQIDASTLGGNSDGGSDSSSTGGGCSKSSSCPQDQRCEEGTCSAVSGLGKSCASAEDCTGNEASGCNTFLPTPACVVSNCAADTALCPTGYVCCAFAGMSSCGPGTTCPAPTMMVP